MPDLSALKINGVSYDVRDPTKAPSGYGLGVSIAPYTKLTEASQLDGFVKNGWYAIQTSGFQIDIAVYTFWMLRVTTYNDTCVMQEVVPVDSNVLLRRFNHHGTWTSWEWENPPMNLGFEDRTTKKYKGKAVYAKLIDLGTMPSASQKTVGTGTGVTSVVCFDVYATDGQFTCKFPWISVSGTIRGTAMTDGDALIVTTFEAAASSFTGTAYIEYTKD